MKLELRGATKRFGRVTALEDVTLEFGPGELVAVLGLNGAGKTTLLRAIMGLTALNEGQVFCDGEPLRRERLDQRRKLFMIPDQPVLFGDMNVLRNIGVYLRQYACEDREGMAEQVAALAESVDMLEKIEAWPGTLSRGQYYKTGLIALCAVQPEVWLLDEPFASGMDAHGINQFRKQAQLALERGSTVIYTTQLVELAEDFSNRICVLDRGKARVFQSAAELHAAANADVSLAKLLGKGAAVS